MYVFKPNLIYSECFVQRTKARNGWNVCICYVNSFSDFISFFIYWLLIKVCCTDSTDASYHLVAEWFAFTAVCFNSLTALNLAWSVKKSTAICFCILIMPGNFRLFLYFSYMKSIIVVKKVNPNCNFDFKSSAFTSACLAFPGLLQKLVWNK